MPQLTDYITEIIRRDGPITATALQHTLQEYDIDVDRKELNSLLSMLTRNSILIRDMDEEGIPTYRIRTGKFEAASGLEVKLYTELVKLKIITETEATLGIQIRNKRNGKTYSLDIAILSGEKKYNIEVDDFGHIRPDALRSICEQVKRNRKLKEPEIDWMDNKNSFTDFKSFNPKLAYEWCSRHLDWCIRYHEELLRPNDITRNLWVIETGWEVMRVWNKEITDDLEKCVKEIKEWVK